MSLPLTSSCWSSFHVQLSSIEYQVVELETSHINVGNVHVNDKGICSSPSSDVLGNVSTLDWSNLFEECCESGLRSSLGNVLYKDGLAFGLILGGHIS